MQNNGVIFMPNTAKLIKIADKYSDMAILVIGDVMLDVYLWGDVARISPEAPVPVVDVKRKAHVLGGATNVVNNIHTLGGKVYIAGVIGKDDNGERIKQDLVRKGINVDALFVDYTRPTTTKTRIISGNQHIVRVDYESRTDIDPELMVQIIDYIKHMIVEVDALVISDYGKGVITSNLIEAVVQLAIKRKKPIIVDPMKDNIRYYMRVTALVSDQRVVGPALGVKVINETSIRNIGQKLLTQLECNAVIIARGRDGVTLFLDTGMVKHIPPRVQSFVYDTTGEIDTLVATVALALGAGADMESATTLAAYARDIVLAKYGTAVVTKTEVLDILQSNR
jgi:D-beta-D-heptose 7-phosphate kinase/D-beta-D-heptose 1-phosphate adenosyltransferase